MLLTIALLGTLGAAAAAGLALACGRRPFTQRTWRALRMRRSSNRAVANRVIGYASAREPGELERQSAAIERGCRAHGWTLVCVVRDNGPAYAFGRRPGLVQAVRQVTEGVAGGLVVESVHHLGSSDDEIHARLRWLARNAIRPVALDGDMNGTPNGRRPASVRR
jgi:DNA invertase Pin-like site-specific DNA recombinase